MSHEMHTLLTPKEFQKWAKISERTYFRLLKKGLPILHFGGAKRIPQELALLWLREPLNASEKLQ